MKPTTCVFLSQQRYTRYNLSHRVKAQNDKGLCYLDVAEDQQVGTNQQATN